jgi:hypothetical protein
MTYQTIASIFADGDCEGRADGDLVRISLFGNINGADRPAVMVGQVILTRHTILRMHNAITKGMRESFEPQQKAKIVQYRRPAAVEGA